MGRLEELAKRQEQQKENPPTPEDFWQELCKRIKGGQLIPIISNSIRTYCIFEMDDEEEPVSDQTLDERLAAIWAEKLDYPLIEKKRDLAEVAQYNRIIKSIDDKQAKGTYLSFLKELLLLIAQAGDTVSVTQIEQLRAELDEKSFADLVRDLNYPHFKPEQIDPLLILAKLPLPIYVTTNYFNFMERALEAVGKKPRTQTCFWSGEPIFLQKEDQTDPNFIPTPATPLVYHLFGLEKYPESMILSTDDYLDFLAKVSLPASQEKPLIPDYLLKALTKSSLLMLGYRPQDWDFKIVFRGIIKPTPNTLREFSLAIQLNPKDQKNLQPSEKVHEYLQKYFGESFKVVWLDNEIFMKRLQAEWNKWS